MSAGLHTALAHLANLKLSEQAFMDSIFLLGDPDRAAFLQHMVQSFGGAHICLWSYEPVPHNCLLFLDGLYHEESSQQPSSSAGSLARRLFDAYCKSINYIDNGQVPGIAFKNNLSYLEMELDDLQRMASSAEQMQFYQEAGIKTVVFMGCSRGEIELGMPSAPRTDLEMAMKAWFPTASEDLPQPTNQNWDSTSSSSLKSLSVDSAEYSPLFTIPSSSFIPQPPKEPLSGEALLPEPPPMAAPTTTHPQEQALQALSRIRNIQFPTIEGEDAAMTKAILAVLSSSSTSSAQNLPFISLASPQPAAFRHYRPGLPPVAARTQKNNMFRRAILFFRNLNMRRRQELQIHGNRPTSTQLQHMISERRRREKLNESFDVLRSLLPPGSKKDKASVLSCTTEYLSSLKSQVAELSRRNMALESQLSTTTNPNEAGDQEMGFSSSANQRVNVEITEVSSSTSAARFLDLRVALRSVDRSLVDLLIQILEFLKQQRNVSLLSVQSSTRIVESAPVHGLVLRLKVEGDDFDECGFQEDARRVVDDPPR